MYRWTCTLWHLLSEGRNFGKWHLDSFSQFFLHFMLLFCNFAFVIVFFLFIFDCEDWTFPPFYYVVSMYGLGGGHTLPIATRKWHLLSGAKNIGIWHDEHFPVFLMCVIKCSVLSSSASCLNSGACTHGDATLYLHSIISNVKQTLEMWHLVSSLEKYTKSFVVYVMKCALMNIVRMECRVRKRVNVVTFHLAVAYFAACWRTSVIHSVLVDL